MATLNVLELNSFLRFQGNRSTREISPCTGLKSFKTPFQNSPPSLRQPSHVTARAFGRIPKATLCRAKRREGSEAGSGSEGLMLDTEALERDLGIAIAEENYAEAAKIRDSLRLLSEDREARVLAANSRFYDAFRAGDLAAMQALWAKTDEACCVHPGARGISGYEDVMTSWEYVWANYEFPLDIELRDVKVRGARGDIGYVTCVELVRTKGSSWGGQFVTNVFEWIDDQWLISVHHASPIDL